MPLDDFYNKITALQEFDIVQTCTEIIHENYEYLTKLLKRQLAQGKDGNNQDVLLKKRGGYSSYTIDVKKEYGTGLGKVTDRVTSYMSGSFYSSIGMKIGGGEFEFFGNVSYFNEIISQVSNGDKIMELNEEHLAKFSKEILIPEIQRRFSEAFNR